MRTLFSDELTEAVLLIDASNAFNCMNRELALNNIQIICPEIATYLINTYRSPANLIVNNSSGVIIKSEEGVTQGDNLGMSFYACNSNPLIEDLIEVDDCSNVWFADDSAGAGTLLGLLKWWDKINEKGPPMGYFPNATKTWLILKNASDLERAEQTFNGTGIRITLEGQRHLGAALGSDAFKEKYVKEKVDEWCQELNTLVEYGKCEPHAAYSAYTQGLAQKWLYTQRTIENIGHLFQPIEDIIVNKFIPVLIGRPCTHHEREVFTLPTRLGGLNIQNPVILADLEFTRSLLATKAVSYTHLTLPTKA